MLVLVGLTGMVASCADADAIPAPEPEAPVQAGGNLLLRISMAKSGTTRGGVPQGGEDGDGREDGQHHENDIDNVLVFRYTSTQGINAPDNTPVSLLAAIPNVNFHPTGDDDLTAVVVVRSYMYTPNLNDQFVVVANTDNFQAGTLGALRNHIVQQTFLPSNQGSKDAYKLFTMSNEGNSRLEYHTGTEDDPHIVDVDIERMAARIDFCIDGSTVDGQVRNFEARDKDTRVGNVLVSHVRVLNGMLNPTYLIKREAESATSAMTYLADEVTPTTRYVCEPTTWRKPSATDSDLLTWFGDSRHALASQLQHAWFTDKDKVHTSGMGDGFSTGTSYDSQNHLNYYVLDYVNENTMTPAATTGRTTTAIAINAVYQPAVVYATLDADGNPVVDAEYRRGQTFWRFRPMVSEYDETQSPCFSNLAAAQAYKALRTDVTGEITEYTQGRCFYIVYLRHDNSPDSPYITPMEFGIVRNNIYRLRVSFTGPGFALIPEETEINPEGIRPYIYVRKWYRIIHPEIEI